MRDPQAGPPPGAALEAARDDPEAYIPRDRRRALAAGDEMPDRVRGAALFADISGFTPLTEALVRELGPQRGAEELTASIDRVFHAVIAALDRFDGNVIYFSGDAITAWLEGDDGRRAVAAGLGMHDAIARTGNVVTPGGASVQLELKVAVAVGDARRFLVGDPRIQRIDVLAGRLIDDLAAAEHHAEKGDLVLDASAVEALGASVRLRERREESAAGGPTPRLYGVVEGLAVEVAEQPAVEPPPLPDEVVRPWLLPTIWERIRTGRGEFLAELRAAYPIFVRFGGIDFDDDPDAAERLDAFVRGAQRVLTSYGGSLLQLTVGDKGAYLYGVFGSPVAHEDDASRAAAAALELRDLERTTAARGIQIGLAHGRLRSGTYGHPMRRTFVCLGDAVNLSARLMSAAPEGGILATERVHHAAGDAFVWAPKGEMRVKGKADAIPVFALERSLRGPRREVRFTLPILGRDAELATLRRALDRAIAGEGRVVGIAAEPGTGKSRLVAEFVREARAKGIVVAFGECESYRATHAYVPWHEIWRVLLGLDDDADPDEARATVESRLAAIDPLLVARAPLLAPVIGLPIQDTELTASFDPKLRKTSLEDLLSVALRSLAAERPLVLVIEDTHWIDELSRDLLQALVRATNHDRVLIVAAYRPAAQPGGGLDLERLGTVEELTLATLGEELADELVRAKFRQLFGEDRTAPDGLLALVRRRSEGNPFYIEELLNYIASRGVDPADDGAMAALELPDSLHSLVLSRVDTVAERPRRSLKVASVVGRDFEVPVLTGAYTELGSDADVVGHLEVLRRLDLVALDRPDDLAYVFRHVVIQEVAYESLPFALRAALHRRVGSWLEQADEETLEQRLDLLAHHFGRSDDAPRKRRYLERAGDAAQRAYANSAAIGYYEALAPLVEDAARGDVLLRLGKVLALAGDLPRAEAVEREALDLADRLDDAAGQAAAATALAEVARRQGRFDEAAERLAAAERLFGQQEDRAGLGQVLHLRGTLFAQQGEYDAARGSYEESVAIRTELADRAGLAALWSNLGVIAEYQGDYAAARAHNERALEARTELGDPWAIGVSQNNLGMIALHEERFEEARERFDAAMQLNRQVGDPWMVAIAHNNLGNATRGLGDPEAARRHYAAATRAYRDYDDRWALAFLLEDVARLAAAENDPTRAFELVGAAETMRAEIGSPRGPALDEELAQQLVAARSTVGDEAADAALDRGRAMGTSAATSLALHVCGGA